MDNQDLKYIKKVYGENFAKLCRELFPQILETPGLLTKVITEKFDPSPTLYDDMSKVKDNFKNYVFSFVNVENGNKEVVNKSPEELFDEAGYMLYPECQTEADIQSFRKYYKFDEELCTFRGGRLDSCRVWFAVKKNVDDIKRENFTIPAREDEYGTSVISIQFTRGSKSTLSIKNRYNHTVNNPDNTFESNLDNIIPGLTSSFCQKYEINLIDNYKEKFHPDGYVLGRDGKLYKINIEIDGNNYCANNIVVDVAGGVVQFDKSKYILVDHYLIDLVGKKIDDLSSNEPGYDSFINSIGKIKTINISLNENKNRVISITPESGGNVQIVANRSNQIIKYSNSNVKEIGDSFLFFNKCLTEINLPNVQKIGDSFLVYNKNLTKINLPNVQKIGYQFLQSNENLTEIDLPNVQEIGYNFLLDNTNLTKIDLPNVQEIGHNFMVENLLLTEIDLPNVQEIGSSFLERNKNLTKINLPNVKEIENGFLFWNKNLTEIDLPNVQKIGNNFMTYNVLLKEINLPNVQKIGHCFLEYNKNLTEISLPNVQEIGDLFLCWSKNITEIDLPNVQEIGHWFLDENEMLSKINLPNVQEIGKGFLKRNKNLTEINLPNVQEIGDYFLYENEMLSKINLPNIQKTGDNFLQSNDRLTEIKSLLKSKTKPCDF